MLYADEHDLGFDPTMTVYTTLDDGSQQYDVVVRLADGAHQTYRTKRLLSNGGGVYLHGRGTRVWEAVRLENGMETGEIVALKDSWVDEYREREGAINVRVLGAPALISDSVQLNETLIPVRAYGDVHIAGIPDRTRMNPDGRLGVSLLATTSSDSLHRSH